MYIKFFNEISKEDVKEVGGKGASLGEMTRVGIPVPPGFIITIEGFGRINSEKIFIAFKMLNTRKVSVRSSAIAEDSSTASWAGQLETYLNVSKEDLIKSIQKCWESIKSERVLSYFAKQNSPTVYFAKQNSPTVYIQKQNLSEDQLKVAVIIQKMVDAKTAGVMFTANPITSDRGEIMIESVLGLGEPLVQGLVTPDNFIVDKKTLEIKSKDLQKTNEQSVSDEDIKKLVKLGIKIEEHWRNPQDIEWAIDRKGKLWILQSRPITTLNY